VAVVVTESIRNEGHLKGKTVLVTGGCGYVGSHVCRQLSEAGYRAVVFDNLSTGLADALIYEETLVVGDCTDEGAVSALFTKFKFDAILHFAGVVVVPESVRNPLKYYHHNVTSTLMLLKFALEKRVPHFIFSSTASIYGDTLQEAIPETAPLTPTNPYSRSKFMSEWLLQDAAAAHPFFKFVILRYFNVAGADAKKRMGQRGANSTHLIKVASQAVVGKRNGVTVYGSDYATADGTGIRDYIHVEDIASAHLSALRYLEASGESTILNCGYGHGFSVTEVLREFSRVFPELKISHSARRPGDVSRLVADVSKIKRTLDWTPRHDRLSEIVLSAIEWEKKI
jgi:UDP-glucose 4-epimerase